MRKIILVLLCSCVPPLSFRVDPTFSIKEQTEINRAAEKWNTITVPTKKIYFSQTGKYIIDEVDAVPGGWNGHYSSKDRKMLIDADPESASTYAVALHEFGHALGLQHTSNGVMQDGSSILAQGKKPATEFSVEDIVECKRVKACW